MQAEAALDRQSIPKIPTNISTYLRLSSVIEESAKSDIDDGNAPMTKASDEAAAREATLNAMMAMKVLAETQTLAIEGQMHTHAQLQAQIQSQMQSHSQLQTQIQAQAQPQPSISRLERLIPHGITCGLIIFGIITWSFNTKGDLVNRLNLLEQAHTTNEKARDEERRVMFRDMKLLDQYNRDLYVLLQGRGVKIPPPPKIGQSNREQ